MQKFIYKILLPFSSYFRGFINSYRAVWIVYGAFLHLKQPHFHAACVFRSKSVCTLLRIAIIMPLSVDFQNVRLLNSLYSTFIHASASLLTVVVGLYVCRAL